LPLTCVKTMNGHQRKRPGGWCHPGASGEVLSSVTDQVGYHRARLERASSWSTSSRGLVPSTYCHAVALPAQPVSSGPKFGAPEFEKLPSRDGSNDHRRSEEHTSELQSP